VSTHGVPVGVLTYGHPGVILTNHIHSQRIYLAVYDTQPSIVVGYRVVASVSNGVGIQRVLSPPGCIHFLSGV